MTADEIAFEFEIELGFHPLFRGDDVHARVKGLPEKTWCVHVESGARHQTLLHGENWIDCQFDEGGTFWLLHIEIARQHRGKGLGAQLYDCLERIARNLGCKRIEQTPSGWTPSGESRAGYLNRRGWCLDKRDGAVIAYKGLVGEKSTAGT